MKKKDIIKILSRTFKYDDLDNFIECANYIYNEYNEFNEFGVEEKFVESLAILDILCKAITYNVGISKLVKKKEEKILKSILKIIVKDSIKNKNNEELEEFFSDLEEDNKEFDEYNNINKDTNVDDDKDIVFSDLEEDNTIEENDECNKSEENDIKTDFDDFNNFLNEIENKENSNKSEFKHVEPDITQVLISAMDNLDLVDNK